MIKNNKERAKELYFMYLGDIFQMMRDGFSREYYKYNISKNQEKEWIKELLNNEFKQLDINDVKSLSSICLILRTKSELVDVYLPKVISFISKNEFKTSSSFNFLTFSQKIIEIIEFYLENNNYTVNKIIIEKEKEKLLTLRSKYL